MAGAGKKGGGPSKGRPITKAELITSTRRDANKIVDLCDVVKTAEEGGTWSEALEALRIIRDIAAKMDARTGKREKSQPANS
jgi:hypothetical protein